MKTSIPRHIALVFTLFTLGAGETQPSRYFGIEVVDEATGRGVPVVELRTVSNQRFYTDGNGLAAIDDPSVMGQKVFFYVESPGYEFRADGFGFHGAALDVTAGTVSKLKIKRINIAERLYRVTGQGIYRDTVLLGRKSPIREPLLNAKVVGQDSVQAVPYEGKLYWFWGDTNRLAYPLGHFGMSGATSAPPDRGGLDPSVGIDLTYFTDATGFSRPTCDVSGDGPKWIDGLVVVKDEQGRERMIAKYSRMKSLETVLERGLVQWDDESKSWKPLVRFSLDAPLYPSGQSIRYADAGKDYFYFGDVRVSADLNALKDPSQYEAFTCLRPGSRYEKNSSALERSSDGRLNWGWKRDTSPVTAIEEKQLLASGRIAREECRFLLRDVQTKRDVVPHAGSVCWNAFKKKWILIGVEIGGNDSFLGNVWYAEADSPVGPWYWAREIAAHPHYSFYNPVQHPFFDQEGGRIIYFEGTYASTFSGNEHPTPLYDYNQLMYRLDLSDPRLKMPERVDHQ